MTIKAIGLGIKTRLETISKLRVYAPSELKDSLEVPCALIIPGENIYATTYSGEYDCTFRIIIVLSKADTPSAFNSLVDYVEPTGNRSIFAAINGDRTLNGSCAGSKLQRNLGIGSIVWGNTTYLTTEFELAVWS